MRRGAILLVLAVSIGVRFWKIDALFDDRWSWRQSDIAAIARNYFETGFHFSRPQIDWAGDQPGFVGTEFPLLPFGAALLYQITGVHEWVGRLLTLVFFVASMPFFFLVVRRAFDETSATLGLIFYSFAPLMNAATRAFIPDGPSLSCALAGFYFFWRWIDEPEDGANRLRNLTAASLLLALAFLLKPTTATIAAPMLALAWRKFGMKTFSRTALWLFGATALFPSFIWYAHAHRISREFYPYHMFGAGGVRIMNFRWYWDILALTFTSSLTPVFFILALVGFFVSRRGVVGDACPEEQNRVADSASLPPRTSAATTRVSPFHWWLLAIVLSITIVGYGNRHEWYRLPLVPVAAALAGTALSPLAQRRSGRVTIAAIVFLFLLWSAICTRKYLASTAQPLCRLGRALRASTPPGALVVAADDGDPTTFYYGHRKGWHFPERGGIYDGNPSDDNQLIGDLRELRARGATFHRGTNWWLEYYPAFADYLAGTGTLVSSSVDYHIYELRRE